ncbi:MAG: ATP-dependent DNA ligase, partial [Actinomycetota bacterium]|nr:ATP-dependent DNA ligase [Actinomycetota bacterium]
MPASSTNTVEIDGRRLKLSNLSKVLYPEAGFTKHDVITHSIAVGDALLPQLAGRPATRKRWPDGVEAAAGAFFEKNVPRGTPLWVRTVELDSPGSQARERVTYP